MSYLIYLTTLLCFSGVLVDESCYFAVSESGIVYSWNDASSDEASKMPQVVERLQVWLFSFS